MRILLTGGAGYLGSVIAPILAKKHKVTVLDNFLYQQWHVATYLASCGINVIEKDIRTNIVKYIKDSDIIIPLAAIVGAPACDKKPQETTEVNVNAITDIITNSNKNQLIIYPNTNSAYGTTPEGVICDENSPINPISHYAKTKQQSEETCLQHTNTIVLRFATVYGLSPRLRTDLIVNQFCFEAARTGVLPVFEGNFRRNFICVQDIGRLFDFILENVDKFNHHVYNVGNDDDNMTKYDLAKFVCDYNEANLQIDLQRKDGDLRDYEVSNKRLYDTGFYPMYTVQSQIPVISEFFKNNFKNFSNMYMFRNV